MMPARAEYHSPGFLGFMSQQWEGNPEEPWRVEGVQELLVDQGNFSKEEQRLNPAYNDGRGLYLLEDIKVGHQNCQKSQKSEA